MTPQVGGARGRQPAHPGPGQRRQHLGRQPGQRHHQRRSTAPPARSAATIPLGAGTMPYGITFDPDGVTGYVTLQATGQLVRLDPASRTLLGVVQLEGQVRGVAVDASGRRVLVTRFISPDSGGEVFELRGASCAGCGPSPWPSIRAPTPSRPGAACPTTSARSPSARTASAPSSPRRRTTSSAAWPATASGSPSSPRCARSSRRSICASSAKICRRAATSTTRTWRRRWRSPATATTRRWPPRAATRWRSWTPTPGLWWAASPARASRPRAWPSAPTTGRSSCTTSCRAR